MLRLWIQFEAGYGRVQPDFLAVQATHSVPVRYAILSIIMLMLPGDREKSDPTRSVIEKQLRSRFR